MKKILLTVAIFLLVVNLVHFTVYQKQDFTSLSDLLIKLESYPQQNTIDLEYIYQYELPELWDETAGSVNWDEGLFAFFEFIVLFIVFLVTFIGWLLKCIVAPFAWLIQNFFNVKDLILYIFKPY